METEDKILKELIEKELEYNKHADVKLIEKAYKFAENALKDKGYENRLPFFVSSIISAKTVSELGLGSISVAATLLHHVISEKVATKDALSKELGQEIANIVDGVSSFGYFHKLKEEEAGKIILSLTSDIRVIIIILADRLTFLKEMEKFDDKIKKKEAQETLNIYAPLAHKLGLNKLKNDLEDMALSYIDPTAYLEISEKTQKSRKTIENEISKIKARLQGELKNAGIEAVVDGRTKHTYGIYNKMKKKNKPFEEIYDIKAVRIVTQSVKECYEALGIVHSLWRPLPGEFDDYIAKPKPNMYQSIHTTVIGPDGKPLEIQIRTEEMNNFAEYGVASHWRYKGRTEGRRNVEKKLNLYKQLLDWYKNAKKEEFLDSLKVDFFESGIYAYTPKGDIIELPQGSTALDFAFEIHSDVGKKCEKTVVNGKIVPLNYELRNGDKVEIITSSTQTPKRHWLSFVKTEKAKKKIKQLLEIKVERKEIFAKKNISQSITIRGNEKNIRLAKCCMPVFGDEIIGIKTTKRKVSVHRNNCNELPKIGKTAKIVGVSWGKGIGNYAVGLRVRAMDKPGVLNEILRKISESGVTLVATNAKPTTEGTLMCNLELNIKDAKKLDGLIEKIKIGKGILEVGRI